MGVDCRLETERGEKLDEVLDAHSVIASLIPPISDTRLSCWRFIDPYGNTVFNRLQMPQFLDELRMIRSGANASQTIAALDRLEGLAERCRDEVHLYLKFYGD